MVSSMRVKEINVYFNGKNRPMVIQNDLGIGMILPIRADGDYVDGDSIIIEV